MNGINKKITAIKKIHREFSKIIQSERCRTCSCFHTDMMASVLDDIRDISSCKKHDGRLGIIEKDFAKWIEDAALIVLHP